MESPIEVVCRFCAAWSDNVGAAELAAFFTDDAVYHNIPLAPVTGREAISNTIASFIRPGAPGIESIEFRVVNIAANGPVVMTERVDVFRLPGKSFELQVMGTFEVRDGKINAWRDYFDQNRSPAGWDKVTVRPSRASKPRVRSGLEGDPRVC
jgi:limonene-1,2-epoxide hydrolase